MGLDILAYNDLGSGAQVRSHLIDQNVNRVNPSEATAYKFGELKCGEGKCGEGKCGEETKAKAESTKKATAKETKAQRKASRKAKKEKK